MYIVYHVYSFNFGFGEYNDVVGVYGVVHRFLVFGAIGVVGSYVESHFVGFPFVYSGCEGNGEGGDELVRCGRASLPSSYVDREWFGGAVLSECDGGGFVV